MRIGSFDVGFLSHVCFLFRTSGGETILTDPLYAAGFEWRGKIERYLSPPDLSRASIPRLGAIFVSHIHGDHYDRETVDFLVERDECELWAPADVFDDAMNRATERAAAASGLVSRSKPIVDGEQRKVGDLAVTFHAGYDGSMDDRGRPNKFSMLLESDGSTIFYSGDCHEPPPGLEGVSADAIVAWPHPDDEAIRKLGAAISAPLYILMHGDRFEPGDFYCNMDLKAEKERVERLLPGVVAVIPERLQTV